MHPDAHELVKELLLLIESNSTPSRSLEHTIQGYATTSCDRSDIKNRLGTNYIKKRKRTPEEKICQILVAIDRDSWVV